MASKSLGTLTLDIVAKIGAFEKGLNQAERKSRAFAQKASDAIAKVSKAFITIGTSAAIGLGALVKKSAESAKELRTFSNIAGASVEEFQKFSIAAEKYGISNEKLADQLKDVRERVGEFLQTGAGPMKDFFEFIAPQVGITADAFRDLSGPQALQLYVDSLQKANLSQEEMSFYLEAIASDTTNLIPLLKDGGVELKRMGEEAERAGRIIGTEANDALADFDDTLTDLKAEFSAVGTALAAELIPYVQDFTAFLSDPAVKEGLKDLVRGLAEVASTLGTIAKGFGIAGKAVNDFFRDAFNITDQNKVEELYDRLFEIQDLLPKLKAQRDAARSITSRRQLEDEIKSLKAEEQATKDSINRLLNVDREYFKELDKNAKDNADKRIQTNAYVNRITQSQLEDALKAQEQAIKESEERIRQMRIDAAEANEYGPQTRQQVTFEDYQEIDEYTNQDAERLKSFEEWKTDLMVEAAEDRNEQLKAIDEQRIKDVDVTFTTIAGLLRATNAESSTAVKAAFALEKAAAIARAIVNIQVALSNAATAPWPANLAAMATVAGQTAQIIATIQGATIRGVAHDGLMSVPQTGTYLLEKGERVTTEKTSAKLDNQLSKIESGQMGSTNPINVRLNNVIDPAFVGDYMGGDEGDAIIDNWITRNQTKVRAVVNR